MNSAELALHVPAVWWIGTLVWFCLLLGGDLYLHRKPARAMSLRRSLLRTAVWVSLGLLLGSLIWWRFGHAAGVQYFSGFLIEKALSLDNIFVWSVILAYLKVPERYHYKVLFWGIFGAIVFRTIFVFAGVALLEEFQATLFLLGALLIISAIRLAITAKSDSFNPSESKIIKFTKHVLPVDTQANGPGFLVKKHGKTMVSMLFVAVCVIELTDIIFAIDSVPASLAVARHPYLVLTSNIAAILGLRALYFVLEALNDKFWMVSRSLPIILVFVGLTLMVSPPVLFGMPWFGIAVQPVVGLIFIAAILTASIVGSLLFPRQLQPD